MPLPRRAAGPSQSRARAYVMAIVEREAAEVAAAALGTGARHTTFLASARTLGLLVGGGELEQSVARAALTAAAAGFIGRAGYPARQVDRDITDGLAYGAKLP